MKRLVLLVLFFTTIPTLFSQNDCSDAIVVCENSGFQNLNATGIGVQELNSSNTCSSEEHNSLWLKIRIKTGGTLGFTLTPALPDGTLNTDINEDFDFFVFGPNATCNAIGQAIRCSTTNPASSNSPNNLTGMNGTETDTSEGPGQQGNSFIKWLTVAANDSYFIVIDRPIGNSNFKINWTGTATFSDPPVVNNPKIGTSYNLEECDDTPADTMEAANFNLSTNTSSIKGRQANIKVTYHTTINDAQTNANPIANPVNFRNTQNPQRIFVRLTNTVSECFSLTDFTLTVKNTFVLNTPKDYFSCDDLASGSNTDGFSEDFVLSTKDTEILGSLKPSDYTVSYYTSLLDAQSNSAPIDKTHPYKNSKNNQEIFVRVVNNQGCLNTLKSFRLIVNPVPTVQTLPVYYQCDVDSNPSDGITAFNLVAKEAALANNAANVTVAFFETSDTSFSLPITNKIGYKNKISTNTQNYKLVVRVTNNTTGCSQLGELQLKANVTALANYTDYFETELDSNASIPNAPNSIGSRKVMVDFDKKTAEIIKNSSGIFKQTTHNFEYYKTKNDAVLQTNQLITPYTQYTFTDGDVVFVRVSIKGSNACSSIGQFKIKVTKIPIPNGNTNIQYLCIANPRDTPQLFSIDLDGSTGVAGDTYQWFLNNTLISGAINTTYKATSE
ncbi:MAG: hypothetical protein ACWIPI_09330, partial [Polaribacter sp.]